jgi:hypothetical protein
VNAVAALVAAAGILVAGWWISIAHVERTKRWAVEKALVEMTLEREYWRTRAERLTDAALVRAGAVHQPTMEAKPDRVQGTLAMVASAMSVQEIDSSKGKRA